MANNYDFTVYMYKNEQEFLKWLVLQYYHIETGGDLFGLWQNKNTAVVQLILGPGKGCSRTLTSFHQDVQYLGGVGERLTTREGLCNIGEWHSHHRIGLTSPSGGDQTTVWTHMPSVSGGRFLLLIANIQDTLRETSVRVGCFMFNSETNRMTRGRLQLLPDCSPLRHIPDYKDVLKEGSEIGQDWDTFCNKRKSEGGGLWRWYQSRKVYPITDDTIASDIECGTNSMCACKIVSNNNTNQGRNFECCACVIGVVVFILVFCKSRISLCFRCMCRAFIRYCRELRTNIGSMF